MESEEFPHLRGIQPVSYTHLDVYKRQTKIYSNISPTVVPAAFANISSPQKYGPIYDYTGWDETKARRFDINYTLGDHDLRAGYDYFQAVSYRGDNVVGPTQSYWTYGRTNSPSAAIDASHYVGSPLSGGGFGTDGYYAVSYTHLDVYKRQGLGSACDTGKTGIW